MTRVFYLLLLCYALPVFSQDFGGNPPSLQFSKIQSGGYRILYPIGADSIASRIADRLPLLTFSTKKGIDLLIQNNGTLSNGYVSLAPWRAVFFTTVPQNYFEIGSSAWSDLLTTHEARHILQYNKFNIGPAKWIGRVFGESARALLNSAAIPDWYFEGDAVQQETYDLFQGRGRLPLFNNGYAALFDAGKNYRYQKIRNGSLRHYTPDHYQLGYLLVQYGTERFGAAGWDTITTRAASFRYPLYPFQTSLKKYSGLRFKQFVSDAFAHYKTRTEDQLKGQSVKWITPKSNRRITNYQFVYPLNNARVLALKSGTANIPQFVLLDSGGRESVIATAAIMQEAYFGCNANTIIYAGFAQNARWTNQEYSDIRVVDLNTGFERRLTKRKRYFTPDIDSTGNSIVCVENGVNGENALLMLNTHGELLHRLTASKEFGYFSQPKFLKDSSEIVAATRNERGEMGWIRWKPTAHAVEWLMQPSNAVVGNPVVYEGKLFFTGSYRNRDALFVWDNSVDSIQLISGPSAGVYQGFARNGRITASYFTAEGYRLGSELVTYCTTLPALIDSPMVGQPKVNDQKVGAFQTWSAPMPVSKTSKLFNFHSLIPKIGNTDGMLTITGQNIFNTAQTNLLFTLNRAYEGRTAIGLGGNFIYGNRFLQPYFGMLNLFFTRSNSNTGANLPGYSLYDGFVGLRLPLNFTSGKALKYMLASAALHASSNRFAGTEVWDGANQIAYANIAWSATIRSQQAPQQIFPHWMGRISTRLLQSFKSLHANRYGMIGELVTPGLFKNNSLQLQIGGLFNQRFLSLDYSVPYVLAKGTSLYQNYRRIWGVSANYHLPLAYPDWGFGQIAYVQRIRAAVFYDRNTLFGINGAKYHLSSVGSEIWLDGKIWNQQPLQIGIRYAQLSAHNFQYPGAKSSWQIILPVLF